MCFLAVVGMESSGSSSEERSGSTNNVSLFNCVGGELRTAELLMDEWMDLFKGLGRTDDIGRAEVLEPGFDEGLDPGLLRGGWGARRAPLREVIPSYVRDQRCLEFDE